jgi:hypothetical protein
MIMRNPGVLSNRSQKLDTRRNAPVKLAKMKALIRGVVAVIG